MWFSRLNYLVGTVFLVDHPSQHPRAESAELGEQKWDRETIPSPAAVFQGRGDVRKGGSLLKVTIDSCLPLLVSQFSHCLLSLFLSRLVFWFVCLSRV